MGVGPSPPPSLHPQLLAGGWASPGPRPPFPALGPAACPLPLGPTFPCFSIEENGMDEADALLDLYSESHVGPGWVAQLPGALSHTPKGCRFDPWSGRTKWATSRCLSVSPSLPLSQSLSNQQTCLRVRIKNKSLRLNSAGLRICALEQGQHARPAG